MGHSVQVIVSPTMVADAICSLYPALSALGTSTGFSLIPIEADFIDDVVHDRPLQETGENEFMLLTAGFVKFLCELSRLGPVAYVETDYFGGQGGQGALVYSGCSEVMTPAWGDIGTINRALELIGVPEVAGGDRFTAIGLDDFRFNDQIVEAARKGDGYATP